MQEWYIEERVNERERFDKCSVNNKRGYRALGKLMKEINIWNAKERKKKEARERLLLLWSLVIDAWYWKRVVTRGMGIKSVEQ